MKRERHRMEWVSKVIIHAGERAISPLCDASAIQRTDFHFLNGLIVHVRSPPYCTSSLSFSLLLFNICLHSLYSFLGATKHLYESVCLSVRPSIRPSVSWSVGRPVTPSHFRRFRRALKHRVASIGSCSLEIPRAHLITRFLILGF